MTTTISAAQGASTAAPSTETEITLPREVATQLQSEFSHHTQDRLEQECRNLVQTTALSAIELGKRLLFIKEMVGHGNWMLTLQRIGIVSSVANRMMAAAVRLLSLPDHARIIAAAKNKSKLNELLVLDDEELHRLNQGEAVRGVSLTTLPETSVLMLRSILKDNGPKAASETCSHGFRDDAPMIPQAADGNITPVVPPTAEPIIAAPDALYTLDSITILQAGDRVQSLHAGRPGRVVRTYADGSACVCWDDGEPQPEGLGHQRVPRALLILSARADESPTLFEILARGNIPVTDIRAAIEVIFKRTGKRPNKMILSAAHFAGLAANAEVKSYLPGHQQGPATVRQLQMILGIAKIEIKDMGSNPILTYEADDAEADSGAQLAGEPSKTAAPFSGCIDPGNDLHVGNRPAVPDQAGDLQALPSVYSMTHGDFNGVDVTLMIHAGKTWMIAEEIAAVLGETPEQVSEIEKIIDHHFTLGHIPEAYTKVRIASTALTARLLDAQAIHLLDVVLDTPASSALFAWMDGLAKIDDAAEASPLPKNDEPTLSQNFAQLEVLHGIAWTMMDQVASQIGALRVVLMEQDSAPSSIAESIHPETLATVAANLIADHDALCDDMEMLTRQIHKLVFQKTEALPESVWFELVKELSKERDALSSEEMHEISSIATNLLCFAHSSPEVGAALGNLVEFSRRHGAFLYHHEPTGTMAYQWLPGMNPVLRKNVSRQAH